MNRSVTVEAILKDKYDTLALEVLTGDAPHDREVQDSAISSPGLALTGFMERFAGGRIQVFGETEMTYLRSLEDELAADRLATLFSHDIPAVFVTKGQDVSESFIRIANREGIPVFRTAHTTREFFGLIKPIIETELAPQTSMHGSLADVYGVGLLFVGESGIGKSECVLDLVERGHRLVADDLVMISKRGHDVLIGKGHELQRHHMEIRGIGIIDVRALFGIRAIRQQKRIEVIVHLEHWTDEREYDRTGLETEFENVLGVLLPRVTVPLVPGKNITVVSEVVAMNHLLRFSGVDSAADFNERLQTSLTQYLREDYE